MTAVVKSQQQQKNDRLTPKKRRQGQRLTAEQRRVAEATFLREFAKSANVTAACREAGISRETLYQWQEHDETFSMRFRQAEAEANDVVRAAIFRRAIVGVDKPLHYQGRLVKDEQGRPATVKEYSDTLLIFLAKSRMPEFRDKAALEVTGKDGGPIEVGHVKQQLATKLADLARRARPVESAGEPE